MRERGVQFAVLRIGVARGVVIGSGDLFFFSSRRRHTRFDCDWSSDVCSSDLYLNGHSDVIAGGVAGSEPVIEEVRKLMQVWGQAIDPMAAWLVDRGMRTLAVRRSEERRVGKECRSRWSPYH